MSVDQIDVEAGKLMEFSVKDIQPNPFRDIGRYPILREKVDRLLESFRSTGVWPNLIGRLNGNELPEIAFGHHRLVAIEEEFGSEHKVPLWIFPLSDEALIKMMARENMEEWGSNAIIEQLSVRAVVLAFADDKISMKSPGRKATNSKIRYAPSFIQGEYVVDTRTPHPYTAESIGDFLGWIQSDGRTSRKVADTLAALELIEQGLLDQNDFVDLGTAQARAVCKETKQAKAKRDAAAKAIEREAKEQTEHQKKKAKREQKQLKTEGKKVGKAVGKEVSRQLKEGEIGIKEAHATAREVEKKSESKVEVRPDPPTIEKVSKSVQKAIEKDYNPRIQNARCEKLEALTQERKYLPPHVRRDLVAALRGLSGRAAKFADRIEYVTAAERRWLSSEQRRLAK